MSSEVLPVTMLPSGSWMAMAGSPVWAATSLATATTGRISGLTPACCMSSSSLYTSCSEPLPWRREHWASK